MKRRSFITGASVGIGRAAAQAFMDDGFAAINLSRRDCPLPGVENIHCDLASEESIAAACAALRDTVTGASSVALVYNASQMRKDTVSQCTSDSLRAVLQTNIVGINSLNQQLLPLLPRDSSVIAA